MLVFCAEHMNSFLKFFLPGFRAAVIFDQGLGTRTHHSDDTLGNVL